MHSPDPRPPLEKLLANLHHLDDHLTTEHVDRHNQAGQHSSTAAGQSGQGKANGNDSHAKTSNQSHRAEYFCLIWLKLRV